ncbi:MAG: CoA pyrophosphatase [Saprospiraceae bacterium]|nr:CoA pyrophosphatase [Saprospiraceae bacterium]
MNFRLSSPLPGWEAQRRMSPVQTEAYREPKANAKEAGVLALLHPNGKDLKLTYIKRPQRNTLDKHSGQVSFPGGKKEKVDKNIIDTAVRETYEEIGINPKDIRILGQLTPLYVYVSNFLVYPSVGVIDYEPDYILQSSEVDYTITADLNELTNPGTVQKRDLKIRGFTMRDVPYFALGEETLWGATAMITSEFVEIIREL